MRGSFLAIIFFPLLVSGQDQGEYGAQSRLKYYFNLYSQADGQLPPSFNGVSDFVRRMELKRGSFRSGKAFLHHLFVKAHQEFLKDYRNEASFRDLVLTGSYNCLGGTALYSILFNHFSFDYTVVQTSYHIFILVDTPQGQVLVESTDPEKGFVDHPAAIRQRIERYKSFRPESRAQAVSTYRYSSSGVDTVGMTAMLGLFHYNNATSAFNREDFKRAVTHLQHAFLLHRTSAMEEFTTLLATRIKYTDKLDAKTRDLYLSKIETLSRRKTKAVSRAMVPLIR